MELCTAIPQKGDPQTLLDIADDNGEVTRVYKAFKIDDYLTDNKDTWFALFYFTDPCSLEMVFEILNIPEKIHRVCSHPQSSLRIPALKNIKKALRAYEIYYTLRQEFNESSSNNFEDFLMENIRLILKNIKKDLQTREFYAILTQGLNESSLANFEAFLLESLIEMRMYQ